jgi:hypothetical protein
MSRFVKTGLLMVLAFVLLGAYRYVSAQEEHSQVGKGGPPPPTFNMTLTDGPATHHALNTTILTSGTLGGASIPGFTYSAIDAPQTVTCPGTSGTCTIVADHWIEVRNTSGASGGGNITEGCLYVDGTADANCNFIENEAPPDGSWAQTSSSHATAGVPHGTHTVQTFALCGSGCNVAYYQVSYRIYKP